MKIICSIRMKINRFLDCFGILLLHHPHLLDAWIFSPFLLFCCSISSFLLFPSFYVLLCFFCYGSQLCEIFLLIFQHPFCVRIFQLELEHFPWDLLDVDVKQHVKLVPDDVRLSEFEFFSFELKRQLHEHQLVCQLEFQWRFPRKEDPREMRRQSTSFLLSLFKFDKEKNRILDKYSKHELIIDVNVWNNKVQKCINNKEKKDHARLF